MERLIKRLVIGLLIFAAVANAALFAGIYLTQDPAPRALDGQRIFTASRPAVVLVQANYGLTVSVPDATLPQASKNRLTRELTALVASGRVAYNGAAIDQAAVNLLLGNPDAYFVPGGNRTSDDVGLVTSGTGFFVSEDGYLITASHVVSAKKEDIRAEIVDLAKGPGQLADLRKAVKRSVLEDTGLTLSDSQLDKLVDWQQRWYDKYMAIDSMDVRYYLASGTVEAGQHLVSTGSRLSLVRAEDVYPGRDVAVMKADITTVPALALAAADPKPGARSYVIGYPRKGYLEEEAQLDATVPPTLTTGTMRDAVNLDSGWTAYGTDAAMTHGNSGGPVLDARGQVLGMASFAETDENGKPVSDGNSYFVPASVIRETLTNTYATAAPGTLTSLHYRALAQDDLHHYRHELAILSQVQSRSPWVSYLTEEISTAQSAVLSGKDQTPPELRGYVPVGAASAGIAILLAATAGIWLRLRRRRAARKAAAAAAQGATMQPGIDLAPVPELHMADVATAKSDTRSPIDPPADERVLLPPRP